MVTVLSLCCFSCRNTFRRSRRPLLAAAATISFLHLYNVNCMLFRQAVILLFGETRWEERGVREQRRTSEMNCRMFSPLSIDVYCSRARTRQMTAPLKRSVSHFPPVLRNCVCLIATNNVEKIAARASVRFAFASLSFRQRSCSVE